jgi:hypothetical protein
LILRQQALGRAGAARDEHRGALDRTIGLPGEVGRRRRRGAVLVQADEGRIDGEAGEAEIIQVAAEGRGPVLGREGQPDVRVFLVGVELELTAPVQSHDLTALVRITGAGFLFDPARFRVTGAGEGLARQSGADGVHPRGHVGDVGQDFSAAARAFQLFLAAARGEAGLGVVDGLGGQVGDAGGDTVIVGHHQAFARHQTRRATTELHRRQAHPIQPRLIDVGAQRLVGAGDGEVVEGPHAFFRLGGGARGEGQKGGGEGGGEVTHGVLQLISLPRGEGG